MTSGCFGDQTFAPSVSNDAGEPTADAGTLGSGVRSGFFSSQLTFVSVTPNAEQPGLIMSVSPDRGDGARMSYVRIEDSAAGWNLFFDDYVDAAPLGSTGTPTNGYGPEDDFRETQIANGLSRTPHTLRFDITFVPGPANDVVKVFLDGAQIHLGTTWEDYYRWTQGTGGPEQTCTCFASRTHAHAPHPDGRNCGAGQCRKRLPDRRRVHQLRFRGHAGEVVRSRPRCGVTTR